MSDKTVWLIGSGPMAIEYAKVLDHQDTPYTVVGRGESSADSFTEKTGKEVVKGGLEHFLEGKPKAADKAIIAVGVLDIYEAATKLLKYGVNTLLLEKPGVVTEEQASQLLALQNEYTGSEIRIAYNRRFFRSVIELKKLIEQEGGVTSFNFEITEWAHVIEKLPKSEKELKRWVLMNSSHVIDLAFYLGGKPDKWACYRSGSLDWHPSAARFTGAGTSETGALFSYFGDWESAGRWSVEVLTQQNRYVLRPMEQLQVQQRGTIGLKPVELKPEEGEKLKEGLLAMVKDFLAEEYDTLVSLDEQRGMIRACEKIAGYNKDTIA